jgi:serine/threonine protein kinase
MDTERNLLFGVVAFQNGAVDADCLAETCADWASEPTQPLADLMVHRGLMTDEQRTEVEKVVLQELASHGGDPQATLAATMDGRSLAAIGEMAGAGGVGVIEANGASAPLQGGHVVLGTLSPGEADSRERYTLTHLHAKGGMGRVWLARDGALGRQIALKDLRPDHSDNSIVCSRFLYEAKITAQLEHPGIVPVYEVGEGDAPYYTMRFVRGHTLSEAVRAYHKKRAAGSADLVGMVDLLSAFASVCHAVAYAHSRGIIHRDLKGQNVVLGDFGEVIVLDWGLAKRVGPDQFQAPGEETAPEDAAAAPMAPVDGTAVTCAAGYGDASTLPDPNDDKTSAASIPGADTDHGPSSNGSAHHGPGSNGSAHHGSNSGNRRIPESGAGPEGTMQGQLLGTPAYMAPEQAQGRHDLVDQRTDIYGLGAILYEILTGRPPFIAPKTSELIRKVCQETPTPPRQIVPRIAPGLEAVCLKALSKEKADRYATAADLGQEVRRWLADEPVKAYAEPWTRRAARWARRHKTSVSAAAALLVTATIALGVSTVLVSHERNEAEAQGQQARQVVHLLTRVADVGFDEQLDPLQEEFLKNALAYYEQFTNRVSRDPAVRLEHGRAYQQMGDIQRKLGRLPESEAAYRKAVEMLQPLAAASGAGHDAKQSLARTRTLLADLLVRRGADKGQAEPLYSLALEAQRAQADVKQNPAATTEDLLRLGQTLKSQGDLLRLNGKFPQARPVYDQAVAELEQAHAVDAEHAEIRDELALSIDARGWIHREMGDLTKAEDDFRRALDLLDKLVAEFPTVPRHREALARAINSLGLIEESTGRLADAEGHLRRELELVDRLAKDFPDRPEHQRELARTLSNLGSVLLAENQAGEAEPFLHRAIAVNGAIAARSPDDVQIRLDLAKDHNNLGELLRQKGDAKAAIASFLRARAINEKLVDEFPDRPRYRNTLAVNLVNLGLAMQMATPAEAEATYRAAFDLFEKLIAAHPDNVEYQIGRARCLLNQGAVLAAARRFDQAEATYRQALAARVETKDAKARAPEWMRLKAQLLNNLGDVLREADRPGAEEVLRQALGVVEELASRPTSGSKERHDLAIAQCNLGDALFDLKRLPEATTLMAKSEAGFERLAADAPKSVDYHSQLGFLLGRKADLLVQGGKLADAKSTLQRAVAQQTRAVELGKNRADTRTLLGKQLLDLAGLNLELGLYPEAADSALKVPQAVPDADRGQAYLDAARILARLVIRAGADERLAQADRDRLTRQYLGRTVVLLREAIDANPKLADRIKKDPEFKALESRPEYQTMMNTLVNLGP